MKTKTQKIRNLRKSLRKVTLKRNRRTKSCATSVARRGTSPENVSKREETYASTARKKDTGPSSARSNVPATTVRNSDTKLKSVPSLGNPGKSSRGKRTMKGLRFSKRKRKKGQKIW